MVGVPSGIGAFFASFLVADRANYHYAHGLSTIVSNNIDNTVFFSIIYIWIDVIISKAPDIKKSI